MVGSPLIPTCIIVRKKEGMEGVVRCKGPLMVAQWLRYCATNRKVAGSIPDGVIGIFQPLKEMSTRSISWG
jgi:hypothetical protein